MCDSCDDFQEIDKARISPRLAALARRFEANMPGEAVPEEAWSVFLGVAGGSIAWDHHKRMLACVALATDASRRSAAQQGCGFFRSRKDQDIRCW